MEQIITDWIKNVRFQLSDILVYKLELFVYWPVPELKTSLANLVKGSNVIGWGNVYDAIRNWK